MPNDIRNTDNTLFFEIRQMIETTRAAVVQTINSGLTVLYWNIGRRINEEILNNERAAYGKQIVEALSAELVTRFGKSFELRNLRRMMQFAEVFPDFEFVSSVSTQLSWSQWQNIGRTFPLKRFWKKKFMLL